MFHHTGFVSSPIVNSSLARSLTPSTSAKRPSFCVSLPPAISMSSARIGHGFDLHRLEPGLPLILGGVSLKHDRGCAAHSDGDAVYHCVVDAILGALSLPDIGQLFPDTDPRFSGAASDEFMRAAQERMHAAGYAVGNLDVTIILERPKMSPHKATIRQNIADLLHTHVDNVNVKAKTHEKVDAVGENRAVAVHTVALLNPVAGDEELDPLVAAAVTTPTADAAVTGARVTDQLLRSVLSRAGATLESVGGGAKVSTETEGALQRLYDTVVARKGGDPSTSWTSKLFAKGRGKIAQKVGEEAVEVVIDATKGDKTGVVKESADLLYHLSVLWADMDIRPDDVWAELEAREGTSGIVEKASRT